MTRYMLILRSTPAAEEAMANVDFEDVIAAMGRFNEELIKAGVLLAGEGLAGPEGNRAGANSYTVVPGFIFRNIRVFL